MTEDHRAHRSLVDDDKLEWLADVQRVEIPSLNALMEEAAEFMDDHLDSWCRRHMKLSTAVGGKRTDRVGQVAIHDERLQNNPDSVVSRRDPK